MSMQTPTATPTPKFTPTVQLAAHPSLKRHLIALVIGSQLMGCTGAGTSAMAAAAQQDNDWAPSAPLAQPQGNYSQPHLPTFGPVTVRPNFQAPSANSCADTVRSREVPGREGQANAAPSGADGWASSSDRRAEKKSKESASDGAAERHVAASGSRVRESMLAEEMPGRRADSSKPASAAPAFAPSPSPALSVSSDSGASAAAAKGAAMADTSIAAGASTAVPNAKLFAPQLERRAPPPSAIINPIVTAGVTDDNAHFAEYLAFRQRTQVAHRPRDITERYLLQVRDTAGRSVSDAEVRVQSPNGQAMWARTDAGGQVWVSPNAFDSSRASTYQITVRKPGRFGPTQATAFLQRGQKSAMDVTLDAAPAQRAQLDLVFLIDATGSMGDEIDKLKSTLRTIANEVARLPAQPDLCFGLVAYRDKGDEYLIRSTDFTSDLGAFQGVLNQLQAGGGGDYPEAMNEALHDTVHKMSWRGNGTTRMVFLLADAPPHLDYGGPQYDDDMQAALGKGIKVFSVGASGLDKQGEYVQRQIAQYTGGKFVFLTYDQAHNPASGPGRETTHDVQNYSVDSLDRLIVRLVREDLAKLGKS